MKEILWQFYLFTNNFAVFMIFAMSLLIALVASACLGFMAKVGKDKRFAVVATLCLVYSIGGLIFSRISGQEGARRSQMALRECIDSVIAGDNSHFFINDDEFDLEDITPNYEIFGWDEFWGSWEYKVTFDNSNTYHFTMDYETDQWIVTANKR